MASIVFSLDRFIHSTSLIKTIAVIGLGGISYAGMLFVFKETDFIKPLFTFGLSLIKRKNG